MSNQLTQKIDYFNQAFNAETNLNCIVLNLTKRANSMLNQFNDKQKKKENYLEKRLPLKIILILKTSL